MKWSQGTHDLASQGHDALNVHFELLKLKEWRTALAGIHICHLCDSGAFVDIQSHHGLW